MEDGAIDQKSQALSYNSSLKVTFSGLQNVSKDQLKSRCILPISVLQKYHCGEKLKAILDAVRKNFSFCHIIIGGQSIDIHNYLMQGVDPEKAYEKARADVERWLVTHKDLLIPFFEHFYNINKDLVEDEVPYEIDDIFLKYKKFFTRCDDWLKNNNFKLKRKVVEDEYKSLAEFKGKIEEVIFCFLSNLKFGANQNQVEPEVKTRHAKDYVMDEIALFLMFNDEFGKLDKFYCAYPSSESRVARLLEHAVLTLDATKSPHWKMTFSSIIFRTTKGITDKNLPDSPIHSVSHQNKTQMSTISKGFSLASSESLSSSPIPDRTNPVISGASEDSSMLGIAEGSEYELAGTSRNIAKQFSLNAILASLAKEVQEGRLDMDIATTFSAKFIVAMQNNDHLQQYAKPLTRRL